MHTCTCACTRGTRAGCIHAYMHMYAWRPSRLLANPSCTPPHSQVGCSPSPPRPSPHHPSPASPVGGRRCSRRSAIRTRRTRAPRLRARRGRRASSRSSSRTPPTGLSRSSSTLQISSPTCRCARAWGMWHVSCFVCICIFHVWYVAYFMCMCVWYHLRRTGAPARHVHTRPLSPVGRGVFTGAGAALHDG